ncbi:MAG: hypothetical protein AAFR31_12215 [Cyanobacteria bacterium J06627_8]
MNVYVHSSIIMEAEKLGVADVRNGYRSRAQPCTSIHPSFKQSLNR